MVIGIWRTRRHPTKPFEAFEKFQREVVIPVAKQVPGFLGCFNFCSETEWGTLQMWESLAADQAAESSPQAQHLADKLAASGLLTDEHHYECFEVHHGFAHWDQLMKHIK